MGPTLSRAKGLQSAQNIGRRVAEIRRFFFLHLFVIHSLSTLCFFFFFLIHSRWRFVSRWCERRASSGSIVLYLRWPMKSPFRSGISSIWTVLFGGNNFVWFKERYRELRGSFFLSIWSVGQLGCGDWNGSYTEGRCWPNEIIRIIIVISL